MAHPKMFDDDDPRLARVRAIALDLPDAAEKITHGHPAFSTTKVFAYYGGSLRVDGAWESRPHSLLVMVAGDERRALLEDARCYVPAYLGPAGWIGFALPAPRASRRAWDEVAELVEDSYRLTAGVRRVARLDAWAASAGVGGRGRRPMTPGPMKQGR
ncbi:hypothetical protein FHX74_003103 [Friedmanniella endophytica]|uniref:YjbR protein n=1 Tax=Microlunatus kandeliicorticis TaxID=1759536 RepID=A0A7W3IUE7_9ACTN|nr:MmcQ/YjbR family DNA-binding protein [Microlunatus kandeliicorticis]MBA8795467.1 hypothetical protein [Microlunatus kandeliicorticis]